MVLLSPFLPILTLIVILIVALWIGVRLKWLKIPAALREVRSAKPPATIEASQRHDQTVLPLAPPPGLRPPLLGIAYLETTVNGSPLYVALHRKQITIGRAEDCDVVIDPRFAEYESVSRQHAQVVRDASDYVLVDLKSTNGVYVNNMRIGRNLLRDGVHVVIGQVPFTFHLNRHEGDL